MRAILLATVALTNAAPFFAQAPAQDEVSPDTLITLQRGACEDRCAVYRIIIFADGSIIYEGRYFVRRTGLLRSNMPPELLRKLIGDLNAGGFFQLSAKYGYGDKSECTSMVAGEPTAILSVSNGGHSKTVLHQHGCQGDSSERVTQLEDEVDRAAGTSRWIK